MGSLRQKVEARKAAERVRGVTAVKDHLCVQLLTEDRRSDADLRGDVLQALMLDTLVPFAAPGSTRNERLEVTTSNGTVRLRGKVRSWDEHDTAIAAAWSAPGVRKVDDGLIVTG